MTPLSHQIFHEPEPSTRRVYPYFLIHVHVGRRPVGQVGFAAALHADWQRPNEVPRGYAVLLRPIVAFAVHSALHEWIASNDPLRLPLREVESNAVATHSCRDREGFRLRQQDAVVAASREPDRKSAE